MNECPKTIEMKKYNNNGITSTVLSAKLSRSFKKTTYHYFT